MKKLILLIAALVLLVSCGDSGDDQVEYLAFRNADGLWGLVAPNGEVLFEGKFKNKPSLVLHGVFSVKNEEGLYKVYTAEAEPKRVGDAYLAIGDFFEGVAPAVPELGYIRYIKPNGKVAFELKEIDGKPVNVAGSFHDGHAWFKQGDKVGFINRSGKVAISAVYANVNHFHDGRAVVTDTLGHWQVIDHDGKRIFGVEDVGGSPVRYEDYNDIGYSEGLLPVKNGFGELQLYDKDGKPVGETIPFSSIQSFQDGVAVISYRNKQALVDKEGGHASEAAYQRIYSNGHLRYALQDYRSNAFRLDNKGKRMGNEEYTTVSLYPSFVKDCDKYIVVRDLKGHGCVVEVSSGKEVAACQPGIDFEFNKRAGVVSQYVDTEKILSLLDFSADGLGGAKMNLSAADIAKAWGINAEGYTRPDFLASVKETPEAGLNCDVSFDDYIMTNTTPSTFRSDIKPSELNATLTLYNASKLMSVGLFRVIVKHLLKMCGEDPETRPIYSTVEETFFTPNGHTLYLLRRDNVFEFRMWDEDDGDYGAGDDMM